MRAGFRELRLGAVIAGVMLLAGGSLPAQTVRSAPVQPGGPPAVAGAQAVCLACHGPYETLIAKTAGYYMPSGETTSPHRYVPHTSKTIPDCRNCHKPHPVPPPANVRASLPEPSTDWCYTCHHKGQLACGTCH